MRKEKLYQLLMIVAFFSATTNVFGKVITINSLKELDFYARESNNTIRLKAGTYKLADFINQDSIDSKTRRKQYQYLIFSGNNNVFNFKGVHIEIDTKLRELLKFPIHTTEIIVSGNGNVLRGLKITCVGDGLSPGGATFEVSGENNIIRNFNITVKGSFPYGYGDLFGKGGPDVIRHKKQSGFLITGSFTKIYDTKLFMRSFGHGFFIQKDAGNIYFENCYVEGETRKTDDILKETSGPAIDVKFRTWTANREGKFIVTPGYMKSLCEDGFRTYGQNKNIRFKNCTAKNTRGGFELRTNGGVILENCTVIGAERAYWFGNNAVVKKCKGDANYGPLLFMEGSNAQVELELLSNESDRTVHALATIQGLNNNIVIKTLKGKNRIQPLPILIGYTHPEHGESMSPYSEGKCENLVFRNLTNMPLVIGTLANKNSIDTKGMIKENKGSNNTIKNL